MRMVEQADGKGPLWAGRHNGYHQHLKKVKTRTERHRAKQNPGCQPAYGKYRGYET